MQNHVSTFRIVYPLKSISDAPGAILDAIAHLTVQLKLTPKALKTENVREFTSLSFAILLAKIGISFYPSLPYLPQENGEAELLNCTLGDMERATMTQSGIPTCFWKFAYASVC
ncbi:hypothetical protein O181_071771 [Austropuccinia psidii MF-1]|uniref:Integrase catalytic domain-containing protein n=1 Tax=Austropuccinia psidii MF-1 TaxID=1389203 RepID=A0A9Q3F7X6_9BASI|nr:hypothetical protein [Austropuccinia psidii MF-1]